MKCLQDQNLTVNFKLNKTVTVERVIFWYWTWETKFFFMNSPLFLWIHPIKETYRIQEKHFLSLSPVLTGHDISTW